MKKLLLCLLAITFLPELLSADTLNKELNLKNIDNYINKELLIKMNTLV